MRKLAIICIVQLKPITQSRKEEQIPQNNIKQIMIKREKLAGCLVGK